MVQVVRLTKLDSTTTPFCVLVSFVTSAPPSLSQRLTQIIDLLRSTLASHAGKHRAAAPIVLLLWPYLHRIAVRFARLVARPAQPRPATPRPDRNPTARSPRLPQGFGWVVRLTQDAAVFSSLLRTLLSSPEMAALLAERPSAGRVLRPLCRMLGIGPAPDLPPALFPQRRKPTPKPTPRSNQTTADTTLVAGPPCLTPIRA